LEPPLTLHLVILGSHSPAAPASTSIALTEPSKVF
jgi:hypothetical protein